MGYTHYWTFRDKPNSIAYARAIRDISKLARFKKDILSGYSAHAPAGVYGGVLINGIRENSHEDFYLPALPVDCFPQLMNTSDGSFHFCKTARKPYDVVVTAALIVLKYRLGTKLEVSSDGDRKEWTAGLRLARKVTGLKGLTNPIKSYREVKKGRIDKVTLLTSVRQ